jgi:hypothetical protein
MVRSVSVALLALATLAGGCLPTDFLQPDAPAGGANLVPTSPFATPGPVVMSNVSPKTPPSAPEVAIVVDKVGQSLVAANSSLGMKPVFVSVGSPQPEIFHRGTTALFVTEGLVKLCKTEGELAAVLSVELGRMVAEREVLANPETRNPEKRLPINVPIGNAGQFSGLDQLQQAEMVKLDSDRRRPSKKFIPPDPEVLARQYLDAAGFDKKELDVVAPLLAQAEKNYLLEKQFKGPSNTPTWSPR